MSEMSRVRTASANGIEHVGHRFRGEFFDRCGAIERWLTMVLALPGALAKPCSDKAFLGDKLKKVREIATADLGRTARILRRPQKVIGLLDRFQPYADLRGVLGHSTQTVGFAQGGEILFLYHPMFAAPWNRIALTQTSQKRLLGGLRALVKEFDEQVPAARPSPSLPLRPKPA